MVGKITRLGASLLLLGPCLTPILAYGGQFSACVPWKSLIYAAVQSYFGSRLPAPILSAQLYAESACKSNASSGIAYGIAQFRRSTAKWASATFHGLGPADPYSARWSIKAQSAYMAYLYKYVDRHKPTNVCDHWALALGSYNWGQGNINRIASSTDNNWFGVLSSSAPNETRQYVNRILVRFNASFISDGWIGENACQCSPQ